MSDLEKNSDEMNEHEQGIIEDDEHIDYPPSEDVILYHEGWMARVGGDYDKALELAPTFKEAYINRAVNRSETEDYTGAIADFNKAIELDANDAVVYFNRGNTKFNTGDKEGARADWTKAKELGADYAADRLRELE